MFMRKIITISILFFSCFCFSQVKTIKKEPVKEPEIIDCPSSSTVQNEEIRGQVVNKENANYGVSPYKRKTSEIKENPLVALPTNFNWLHHSVV